MKPLHFAVDCRLMYYRKSGISQYTRRLAQAMCKQLRPNERLSLLMDRRDADTAWVPSNAGKIAAFTPAHHKLEPLLLPLELALHGIDVLHSPDFIATRGAFRKIITIHDLYFMEHPEVMSADGARYYGQIAQSAKLADGIIAVSNFTRDDILRLLPGTPREKVRVVYEAADNLEDGRQKTEDGGLAGGGPSSVPGLPSKYALFIGTFEPRKNIGTLLRAAQRVMASAPDFELVIVGEKGWVDDEPSRLAQTLAIQDHIHFTGWLDGAAWERVLRNARVLCMPSLYEGFGLPVLEAMTRGVPVVCSNSSSLKEIAGDAALLHDPCDVDALASQLARAWADDALCAGLSARGRARAAQFSWQIAAEQTLEMYRNKV
ncbi:MAG TPA: glycosyltransferase family 1 protein [Thermoflexales bacterium]|nr:glycosyltransferase family 1 protein [Thermoflexales bacterium]